VRWVEISKNGDDQPDWEVEHNSYLFPVKNRPLFYMKDGSLFKDAYLVDSSIYRKRSVSRPMQGSDRFKAMVKVNGRFFEYRYGFKMRYEGYEDAGGELSIKAEIVSTNPPRIKREQQVKWPDGLTSVTEFVYELQEHDEFGRTPLHNAAIEGRRDVVGSLVAAGADVNARDNNGATPLCAAAGFGQRAVVDLLLSLGADREARSYASDTPLYTAAAWGHLAVVELLIEFGADVNARNKAGLTPLRAAENQKQSEVAALLRSRGAK